MSHISAGVTSFLTGACCNGPAGGTCIKYAVCGACGGGTSGTNSPSSLSLLLMIRNSRSRVSNIFTLGVMYFRHPSKHCSNDCTYDMSCAVADLALMKNQAAGGSNNCVLMRGNTSLMEAIMMSVRVS